MGLLGLFQSSVLGDGADDRRDNDFVWNAEEGQLTTELHYEGLALIVVHELGVAAFDFTDSTGEKVGYNYRLLTAEGEVESGDGVVMENYERIQTGPNQYEVVDKGSQLQIEAGDIRIQWSMGGKSSGWIYFQPEEYTIIHTMDKFFDRLDLSRFLQSQDKPS